MIFIGNGALLKKAISYTFAKGYLIDKVFSSSKEIEKLCGTLEISYKNSADINNQANCFESADKVVFSINNNQILKEPLLSMPDYRFYNIHNGIIPMYRGLPEVCIIHALLNKEKKYGVSIHKIDQGIDTGACYGIRTFPITRKDTFQSVMLKGIENCHLIFKENLSKVLTNQLIEIEQETKSTRLYTYKDLEFIHTYLDKETLSRALYLGVFKLWYKNVLKIVDVKGA